MAMTMDHGPCAPRTRMGGPRRDEAPRPAKAEGLSRETWMEVTDMHEASPTTLYRLFDAGGDLLYVGIAGNPGRRFTEHAGDKPWWGSVTTVTLEHFTDRLAAARAELDAIRHELPLHNIRGVPSDGRWARPWPGTINRFADLCEDCERSGTNDWITPGLEYRYPARVWVDGDSVTAHYQCPACGHRWTCWWSWRIRHVA